MRTRISVTVLGLGIVGLVAMHAQQGATLTALDFYEIQELNARYNHGLDSGDGNLFASVFAADGVLVDEFGRTTTGRDQLTALAAATPRKGTTNVSHFSGNLVVDPAPGGAIVKSMAMINTARPDGQPGNVQTNGQYWDDLVKTADGWRIKKRTFYRQGTPRPQTQPLSTTMPTFAAAPAQQKANGLTTLDHAEIYQLYSRSAQAFDKAWDFGRMWANLFTPDGTYVDAMGKSWTGRDQLMELIAMRGPTHVTTFIWNIMLEPTPSGVSGKAYLLRRYIPPFEPPPGVLSGDVDRGTTFGVDIPGGMFFDQLVKTTEGWRFKARYLVAPNAPVPSAVAAAFQTSR